MEEFFEEITNQCVTIHDVAQITMGTYLPMLSSKILVVLDNILEILRVLGILQVQIQ